MKRSTKDRAGGMLHKVKGGIKEAAGKLGNNPALEAEGKIEKLGGKFQEKVGKVEKKFGG